MSGSLIRLAGLLAALCAVHATYTLRSMRCECNGKSRYCMRDGWGLRCIDCQGNTEGRHCERCKGGFYQQGPGQSCMPCNCNPAGSANPLCDSRGRCSCRDKVSGDKCDVCPEGPIGPSGCRQSRQPRQEVETCPCFCFGHSTQCSAEPGFSVHKIASHFTTGVEGWRAATAQGVAPDNVHFRWSPKHQDIEVISKDSLPVYLHAPAPFLGNKLLSYGQNLSFALRLDRGVRHPSTHDVVLEGSGQRVSASLGDLRSIVPCGQKITYSFRLDERPGSRWRPQLTPFQFQTLLQNLTTIKIRATFGENGRGYLDNVQLVSAQRGDGPPAGWVQSCRCPPGHQGQFCERCASGFKRRTPELGAFSPCEPCSCRGGNCDPDTGDCYSADETSELGRCPVGYYSEPEQPLRCVPCPCPAGGSCSLNPATRQIHCDRCPPGTTGSSCHVCEDGFYGSPAAGGCRPCQCNGHMDPSRAGSCDPITGECLRCVNNTRGRQCEACVPGFYHRRPADACKPCECDVQGSRLAQCDDEGQCECRPGFEGLKCHRSACPACFDTVKSKMELYAAKLQELQTLFSKVDGGLKPDGGRVEEQLRAAERQLSELQRSAQRLAEVEKGLQDRLSSISRSQLAEGRDLQAVANMANNIRQRERTYESKVNDVQTLIDDMRRKLEQAKSNIQSADFPQGDEGSGSGQDLLSSLARKATELADKHQTKADAVEKSAKEALGDAEKSLGLVRNLMNRENKVKEQIGDLKAKYDSASAQVKGLESQASRLSDEAQGESKMADGMLKQIANMEREIPAGLKDQMDAAVNKLDDLKTALQGNVKEYQDLQDAVEADKTAAEDLLSRGKTAQQDHDQLLARVNAAKAETSDALQGINGNLDELNKAVDSLTGFDQQVDKSKSAADAAIKKLPAINATIQQANKDNKQTLSILGAVEEGMTKAQETISLLDDAVSKLEGASGSLPPHNSLVKDATKLKENLQGLQAAAAATEADLSNRLNDNNKQRDAAEEAAAAAAGALNNARNTRDAVGQTLNTVNNLLAAVGQPGSVDEKRLSELEESVADAQRSVDQQLKPRLRSMEELEAKYRNRLIFLNLDIRNILDDIDNLEEILRTIPEGCYNQAPVEHP